MVRPLSRDIEAYVLDWRAEPWPLDLDRVFGRRAPRVLEIGYGNGDFLADLAAARPDRDHLGLELSWSGATRLFSRLRQRELGNVRTLLGDATVLVERLLAPGSLAAVHVNHPCPWPKARHHGRRLLTRGFLELLASRMAPGAPLTMITDHAEYAAWLHEELDAQRALESLHPTAEVGAIQGHKPTKYQRKAMDQGVAIHFFEWRRRQDAAAPSHPAPPPSDPAETPMLSVTLAGEPDLDRTLARVRDLSERGDHEGVSTVVKLEGAWRGTDGLWLVTAMTQEDGLRQDFALMVIPQEGGALIKLGELGRAHPTTGVKRALRLLTLSLLADAPGVRVVHQNLGAGVLEVPAC